MAKYDYSFKKQVVEAYQSGTGSYQTLANQFDIASISTVRKWVKTVEKLGFNGLHRRVNYQHYSSKFKQDVIHYYLTSGDSYLTVALKYGLPNDALVLAWHQKFLKQA
ncbi:helix-turn-helix domain-containing protein [Enterococcus faecalis]|uniref:helix-turn-helix domain-containing protein n=1 Tax=Enterococcus faecalis TaxID=1351 RepID=UPI0029359048|nr:transposase [Enterococcus faecalis]MDV2931542.1 transposase [Enterococcus faecalis]